MEGVEISLENLTREVSEIKGRMNINETEITNIKISLGRYEEKLTQVFSILTEIKDTMKAIANKIDIIEKRPGLKWDKLIYTAITVVVSCAITWFLTK